MTNAHPSPMRYGLPELVDDQTAHEPDLAVADGAVWIAWSARGREGDRIRVRRVPGGDGVMALSDVPGIECQPCIFLQADGSPAVVWVSRRDGAWRLILRELRDGRPGPERVLATSAEGLFHPRCIDTTAHGGWVVYEEISEGQSRIASCDLTGQRREEIAQPEGPCSRPALSPGPEGGLWIAYDCYRESRYQVFVQRVDVPSDPIAVTRDGYQNLQPSLASDSAGNLWIAWASNRQAAGGPWWMTKWTELCRFDGRSFAVPAAPRPDVDLRNEDAWQGWEFPAVSVDRYDRVWIVGQSSHTLYAQSVDGDGWSPRRTIAERRWGSWKPRVRLAGKDPLVVASMGLGGAQVQHLEVRPSPAPVPLARPADPVAAVARARPTAARAALTTASGERLEYYFGDLHAHSVYSDALNDADEIYHRYRDAYGYDFAALTDHDFLDGIELSRSELSLLWNHADRVSRPGAFIALYGYEWTAPALADHAGEGRAVGEGHRHVLYPDHAGPLVSYGEPGANTGAKLLTRLRGRRALVIPHHTAWSGTDWDAHDPDLQRLVEVCSTHGRFEYPGNRPIGYRRDHLHAGKFVLDALARGYRLGFVGGSDSHGLRWHATEMEGRAGHIPAGTRVGWKEDAYRGGMTVILAPALTREALFEALYNRRCYATSGEKIILDFRVNGALMGSEITAATPPRLTVTVQGTAPIRSIEVVRSGHVFGGLQSHPGEGLGSVSFAMDDRMIIPGESHYYYVRVLQEDGNMAWSSPVWVRQEGI